SSFGFDHRQHSDGQRLSDCRSVRPEQALRRTKRAAFSFLLLRRLSTFPSWLLDAPNEPQKFIPEHECWWPVAPATHVFDGRHHARRHEIGCRSIEPAGLPANRLSDFTGIRLFTIQVEQLNGQIAGILFWVPVHEVAVEGGKEVAFG